MNDHKGGSRSTKLFNHFHEQIICIFEKDYWIVNGRLGSNEEPAERGVEPRGEGVN